MRDVRSALLRSDAFVYAIAIDSPERQADQHAGQRRHAARDHRRERRPHRDRPNSADLADATARIAEELNSQYVLGYYSSQRGATGSSTASASARPATGCARATATSGLRRGSPVPQARAIT